MERSDFSDLHDPLEPETVLEHRCKTCGEVIPGGDHTDLITHMWFHDSERLTTICRCQHHEWAHRFGQCIGDRNMCRCIDFQGGMKEGEPA